MSETDDAPILRPQDELPEVQARLEESWEWVIETYRKHQLKLVTGELNELLGEERGPSNYIEPVLLDINPIHHRQSLQEKVFPAHRAISENLLDVPGTKLVLEAGCGEGKTTFLKIYQEEMLREVEPGPYPLVVYFDLGKLPAGSGFARFFEYFCPQVAEVILKEKEEDPELELDEELLAKTVRSLVTGGKVLFLFDNLDLLSPQDRFQVYFDLVVEEDAVGDNFFILARRPVNFGPMATSSIIQRGKGASFRMSIDKPEEDEIKNFLGEDFFKNRHLEFFKPFFPELLENPVLLAMVSAVSSEDDWTEIKTRSEIYQKFFRQIPKLSSKEGGDELAAQSLDLLADVSFNLMLEGQCQRYEENETGFDNKYLEKDGGKENILWREGKPHPDLQPIIQFADGRWAFRHPSFQEFLTARSISKNPEWKKIVREHCRDEKFANVLHFLPGLLSSGEEEYFDILLEEGALFPAGNSMPEAKNLPEGKRLVIGQFLKYQCNERCPQFSRNRLLQINRLLEKTDRPWLEKLIAVLLTREKRDTRILFGIIELLVTMRGIDFIKVLDTQDFDSVFKVDLLEDFLKESKNPDVVDIEKVSKWNELVTISAGKFIYQMDKDEEDKIEMREYSIMKFLVTNELFKEFDPQFALRYPEYSNEPDHPVVGINFFEATVFAMWLGMRLPLEKEWEKASRGTDGRDYPWGEAAGYQSGYCNTADFVEGKTTSVEEFEQGLSPYGCFDMAGNVWEWCVQLYSSRFMTQKIVRGGSWINYLVHSKCTYRNSFDPSERHLATGLRCVTLPIAEVKADDEDDEEF